MPKILLVEDNEMNRDMLSRRLDSQRLRGGHAPSTASRASTRRIASAPISMLMDMDLPIIDGWEATRRIKAADTTRAIPVIALTAHAMAEHRDKALAAGCDDYDTKPVDFPRLLGKIEALLTRVAGA